MCAQTSKRRVDADGIHSCTTACTHACTTVAFCGPRFDYEAAHRPRESSTRPHPESRRRRLSGERWSSGLSLMCCWISTTTGGNRHTRLLARATRRLLRGRRARALRRSRASSFWIEPASFAGCALQLRLQLWHSFFAHRPRELPI